MVYVGLTIQWLLWLFQWILIGRVIISWAQVVNPAWTPKGIVLVASETVLTVSDPPVIAVRRVIRPVRMGTVSLDLSILVLFLVVTVLMWLNQAILL